MMRPFPVSPLLLPRVVISLLALAMALPVQAAGGLQNDLDRILRRGSLVGGELGAVVLRPGDPRFLYQKDARRPMAPASNMKLLTSLAALSLLGPGRQLDTELLAADAPGPGGLIPGPLWVRGAGDPALVGEAWWLMARELRLAGVREIRGGLVADTSLFGGPARPPGWPATNCDRPYCAPFDALMANFSSVEIRVAPGSRSGEPVRVGLFPLDCGLQVDSQAHTTTGGSRANLQVSLVEGGETGRVVVRGTLGRAHEEVRTYRQVPQAALYALGCLRDALQREGVSVAGKLRGGMVPGDARILARHRSRPLHALVADMNRYSNNVMAESLIKLLSAGDGTPGTTKAGLQRLLEHLGERGVDTTGWSLADGSGLSRTGRVTALGIAGVLRSALDDPSLAPEMIASLAVGGGVGTLSDRLLTSGRRVRAKTGTISGAVSLAGYVYPEGPGLPLVFAFLINGPAADKPAARKALDRAAVRLLEIRHR